MLANAHDRPVIVHRYPGSLQSFLYEGGSGRFPTGIVYGCVGPRRIWRNRRWGDSARTIWRSLTAGSSPNTVLTRRRSSGTWTSGTMDRCRIPVSDWVLSVQSRGYAAMSPCPRDDSISPTLCKDYILRSCISMAYEFSEIEKKWRQRWEDTDLYRSQIQSQPAPSTML